MADIKQAIDNLLKILRMLSKNELQKELSKVYEIACNEQETINNRYISMLEDADCIIAGIEVYKSQLNSIMKEQKILKSNMESIHQSLILLVKNISSQTIKSGSELDFLEALIDGKPDEELKKYLRNGGDKNQ